MVDHQDNSCGCKENGFASCNGETCTCESGCGDEKKPSAIKRVVAVMSGKGGVGKSTVTGLLAAALSARGLKVGILDADITGPSIPRLFGMAKAPASTGAKLPPAITKDGIKIISINLFLPAEDEPVIWRGPLISGVIKQFWEEAEWGELDYMLVDLPPGTGDAPLTVMQTLPLDGAVIVTSPQDLAKMVVKKAIKMATRMNIPILGIVENMSYVECPDCDRKIFPFGQGRLEPMCREFNMPLLGVLPLKQDISFLGDEGRLSEYRGDGLKVEEFIAAVEKQHEKLHPLNLIESHVQ
jgi:Mrp family chromosome partitioning ATPase